MNRVEQAVCRIREKLPNNQGFVTLGVGSVIKNDKLAANLGWKCPNFIITSAAVLSPEYLALDRIFIAEFLVFDKKGFEVFDLKLAAEFCRTVSGRAMDDEEVSQLPNNRVTLISVEPLDKRGFLKRMVKKSSLQTTRPIDCFDFQNFQNELSAEGIFCNVIREFGSLAEEFETRTYKFKYNEEKQRYFLEDFGHQVVELDTQSFPDDQKPLGGVIFSKLGAYVGSLGYSTSELLSCFVPDSLLQGDESQEENQAEEEKSEKVLSVEEAGHLDDERQEESKLPTDENKNKESIENNKIQEEKIVEEQPEDSSEQEQSSELTQDETEVVKTVENIQISEKGFEVEEFYQENLKTSEGETLTKGENDDPEVSENAGENLDDSKAEESSCHELVISVESSDKESCEDVENIQSEHGEKPDGTVNIDSIETEKNTDDTGEELVSPDGEMGSLDNEQNVKVSDDGAETDSSQNIESEPSVISELGDVSMATNENKESTLEETTKIENELEPNLGIQSGLEVNKSDDEILETESYPSEKIEVRGASYTLEAGTESSAMEKNPDVTTDQDNSNNQVVEAVEGKVNENKSTVDEDNNILTSEDTEKDLHEQGETSLKNPVPTLEDELDQELSKKMTEVKSEEVQDEGELAETTEALKQQEALHTDATISSEVNTEIHGNFKEKISDVSESSKAEEAPEHDKPDIDHVMEEEVLKLEPTHFPRKPEDVGESLEPDALLSATITNNPKVLDDLAPLLDTEYQHGGVASWQDMAILLDIPKEAYDHCLSYSKSSPTESLMMFLSTTKPQFTISDLKDSLRCIGRTDVVHILDRYIAGSVVSDESVIVGVVERDDTDLLGELALKLDRGSLQNWKALAIQLEVPRRIFKHFGSQQRQNPALLMLKYLPIFDPDLTVQSLKDACEVISRFDVVQFLDTSGVPGDDAVMDILEDTDIIDEVTDLLNDEELGLNWRDLAKELKVPEEKFPIFETSTKKSPTKLLLQSIEQCEPDITVEELILALVAMKRHDVIDMLYKHFKRSDIRTILEENNCLPPEPEVTKDKDHDEEGEDNEAESFA